MFLVFIGFLIQDLIDLRDSILGASSSFLEVVEMVCTGLRIFLMDGSRIACCRTRVTICLLPVACCLRYIAISFAILIPAQIVV